MLIDYPFIVINGNADQPVVMSSADGTGATGIGSDDSFVGGGDWGGLIIDGFAVVNEGAEVLSEAAPDGVNRFFGGSDPTDNSGSINYLVIAESGEEFRQDEEIQGLTLEGVGSGTTIDFVQIHNSDDDGIELFGGTVNLKHAIVIGVDDDSFDFDLGWQGGLQFGIAVQIDGQGDRTIESDNNGDNFDLTPITMPTFSNVTLIGRGGRNDADTIGALHREGLGGLFHKMIITDAATAAPNQYEDGCLDIDDTTARITAGQFAYQDAIFNCGVPGSLATSDEDVPPFVGTAPDLAASVLPSSRSVQVGNTATAFASVTNATGDATNALTGTADTPVDIPAGGTQSFLFAFTPSAAFDSTDVQLSFNCTNKNQASAIPRLNTLLLSATTTPEADIIGLTTTVDLQMSGSSASDAFAVATANVGAAGDITATATPATGVPVSVSICETDPTSGACISPAGPNVTTTVGAGATPTFAVFVTATGDIINDPANNRIFVNFDDGAGSRKGSTSTAVRTQ